MQMEEKTMVADTLTGINGELVRFGVDFNIIICYNSNDK